MNDFLTDDPDIDDCTLPFKEEQHEFPRLMQHYTPEQLQYLFAYLSSRSLKDLRRRQDVHTQQIGWAYNQKNDEVLVSEQMKLDLTSAAVQNRVFEGGRQKLTKTNARKFLKRNAV